MGYGKINAFKLLTLTSQLMGPVISHTPLGNTEQVSGSRPVNSVITPSGSAINSSLTKLYYSYNSTTLTNNILLTNSSGNNWTANLPMSTGAGTYRYYLTTTDMLGRTSTSPYGAPANYYTFVASVDTIKPVITYTPLANTPKGSWPATVTASVTDNIGVDSAWVRWYKNNATTTKTFKLINTTGSTFAATFNSLNTDVAVGDSIFYRIIAQDNSSAHNRDSSVLNKFKIVTLRICENFGAGIVPPTGWTVSGTYWLYDATSAYGTGTGDAKFDFWNATAGTNETMSTMIFDPTLAGDSIKFDIAHAYYSTTAIDSLVVETSTNGGTTFTTLAKMYSGTSFTTTLCMSTVSATAQFTPTAAQWKSRAFILPVGTNKINFRAKSAYGNNLYIDNICLSAIITNTTLVGSGMVPENYTLAQNYPNPFNPTTKINFAIPKQGLLSLRIYDILGREVATLVNEFKTAGYYSVDFNASELSSGIYFYKVEVNGFIDVKRMVLLK